MFLIAFVVVYGLLLLFAASLCKMAAMTDVDR